MKKTISIVLALVMAAGLLPVMEVQAYPATPLTPIPQYPISGHPTTFIIDVAKESITIPPAYTVAAYSTNGGGNWKKGTVPENGTKALTKLFDKGMTLWLAKETDAKGKGIGDVVKFAPIEPRPKGNVENLVIYYNSADEHFELKSKTKSAMQFSYNYAETANGPWTTYNAGDGLPRPENGKKDYFFYTDAQVKGSVSSNYMPKGPVFKLTFPGKPKKPNLKIDYKKETIKIPKNLEHSLDGDKWEVFGIVKNGIFSGTANISDLIDDGGILQVRIMATEKQAPSDIQFIPIRPRAVINANTPNGWQCMSGKIVEPKENIDIYEVKFGNKWVSPAKINKAGSYPIRVKETVRVTSNVPSGTARSEELTLVVTVDVYDTVRNKKGVVKAVIE